MLVIENATVVDVDGARDGPLTIENGEVADIGETPDDPDTVIDGDGGVVAPGLVDSHVHIAMDGRPNTESVRSDSTPTLAYRAAKNLRETVEAGVTTVRDLGSPGTLGPDTRDAIADGSIPGPRVVPCGSPVVITGGHGHWFGREADGPAEVRKAVREQLKKGAEVVKTMATGGVLTEGAEIGGFEMSPAELDALVDAASAKGRPTAAHCHGATGIENAVRVGISSVEHGTFMDREAAELMAENDTYWVPTASALSGITENGSEAGIPKWAVEKAEQAAAAFEDAWDHALDAGVPIAMGTDAGTPFNHHRDAATELERMVEHGLSPEATFEAATVNAADLLGLDDVGRLEPGARADCVVLDSDPREDVSVYAAPKTVVANGVVV
ncbi:amidohydrolase family protein [Halococcus sp. IIIV-5B]|uniref:metal-dependent hydrolase family protein n=1 Tax=Halococcus sp. IIIV-5B TaxID=2321230 RepID=UPI000E74873A|nr:amidohydrolase family protein [Halococcus sp. IIIV-5B]RJS96938.1 amidohydrolase family protein [Halococcus sp. IIIV-5B]